MQRQCLFLAICPAESDKNKLFYYETTAVFFSFSDYFLKKIDFKERNNKVWWHIS